jgi:cell division septum initiation protein DivIVA
MRRTCEQFLMSYRDMLDQISVLDDQIAEAEMIHRHLVATYDADPVRSSHGQREAESPEILDLKARKEQMIQDAKRRRGEVERFIRQIGDDRGPNALTVQRYRRALHLYYCDLLSWTEIRKLLRTTVTRKGRTVVNVARGRGISETAMFRIRSDALAQAEVTYQRMGLE